MVRVLRFFLWGRWGTEPFCFAFLPFYEMPWSCVDHS